MRERNSFDYALVRVVPRVERGEFLNVGVILFCSTQAFLEAKIELDHARLKALAPLLDIPVIESYLEAIPKICAGGGDAGSIGSLPQRARFHWLVAPRRYRHPDLARSLRRASRSLRGAREPLREAGAITEGSDGLRRVR